MGNKTKDFFTKYLGYLVVFIVSAIYIVSSLAQMGTTGRTIGEIITDGALALLLGMFINIIFDLQGMMNGDRSEEVRATIALHGQIVERISPYIERLDDWCEKQNKENLRVQRSKILAGEGMCYSDYFDEEGRAKPFIVNEERLKNKLLRRDELKRLWCYRKALRLKLTPLTASGLTSEGGKSSDPGYLGRTKGDYTKESLIKDFIVKAGTAIIFGYYGVELVQDFSYADLIWKSLQVAIFIIAGVIKMYQSYMFVKDEYRGRIIKKIDNLQKFENSARQSTYEIVEVKDNGASG